MSTHRGLNGSGSCQHVVTFLSFSGQFVVKLSDQTALVIDLQDLVLGVEDSFDVLELESLTNLELLFQNSDVAFARDPANKGDLTHTDGDLSTIE